MKPIKRINPASNLWSPSRRVWFQKNDDDKPIKRLKDVKNISDRDSYDIYRLSQKAKALTRRINKSNEEFEDD